MDNINLKPVSILMPVYNEQYILAVYLMSNMDRVMPLLPTAYICRESMFAADLAVPMIELGPFNDGWHGGGAMWFTKS